MSRKKVSQDKSSQVQVNKGSGTSSVSDRVEWAKWFLDHDYNIFPLKRKSKTPFLHRWQQYCLRRLTENEANDYMDCVAYKDDNYAIPCGQNNLVVLDFEDIQVVQEWTGKDWLNDICSKTLCVTTPHGGIHVYLTSDEIPSQKFNPVFKKGEKGIADLQSKASYVVAPHSCQNHKECDTEKCPYKGQDVETCYTPLNKNEIA